MLFEACRDATTACQLPTECDNNSQMLKKVDVHTFTYPHNDASNSILKKFNTTYCFQHTFWRQAQSPTGSISLSQALAVDFYSTDPQLTFQ